jgi:phosphate transport system protein
MLRQAIQAFATEDAEAAQSSVAGDDAVDALYEQTIKEVVASASALPEGVAAQLDLLSVAKNLERIADHATNIAEDVLFLLTGQIVRHGAGGGEFSTPAAEGNVADGPTQARRV